MVSTEKRRSDILELIRKLDISPTMHKDAVEKYKNLSTFLQEKGIDAEFYPQGSFSIGTVVRPYSKDNDAHFDLDAICQIKTEKDKTTPKTIKETVEDAFAADGTYKAKLTIYDKCCTINYAETNGTSFSIDIVSAVDEDELTKGRLLEKSLRPEYLDTAIAISSKNDGNYEWVTNNPKGFKQWFDNINRPFLEANALQSRSLIFESYKGVFASVEDIPLELERSALQRVIQILKRHRDVYFSKKRNGDSLKPNSAIITTIVSMIASGASPSLSVFDLLNHILAEFDVYSEYQTLSEERFRRTYESKNVIKRPNGLWVIENPVNPEDNLADGWNKDAGMATAFFAWSKYVTQDLLHSFEKKNEDYLIMLEAAFGSNFVRENIDTKKYSHIEPKQIDAINQSQPWRR